MQTDEHQRVEYRRNLGLSGHGRGLLLRGWSKKVTAATKLPQILTFKDKDGKEDQLPYHNHCAWELIEGLDSNGVPVGEMPSRSAWVWTPKMAAEDYWVPCARCGLDISKRRP